jgi:hypothetical protein
MRFVTTREEDIDLIRMQCMSHEAFEESRLVHFLTGLIQYEVGVIPLIGLPAIEMYAKLGPLDSTDGGFESCISVHTCRGEYVVEYLLWMSLQGVKGSPTGISMYSWLALAEA